MTRCRDTSLGFVLYLGNGRPSLVLGDDHSHMGGSDDMKSGFVLVEIGLMLQTSYLYFWGWTWFVHYGLLLYITFVYIV